MEPPRRWLVDAAQIQLTLSGVGRYWYQDPLPLTRYKQETVVPQRSLLRGPGNLSPIAGVIDNINNWFFILLGGPHPSNIALRRPTWSRASSGERGLCGLLP
jgi:hypothetical protein